ncbi:MAG: GNAT family N-acetyltransferase [Dermatophilaceae bacterium]
MPATTVRTNRLVLRPPTPDDEEAWVGWHTDPVRSLHAPHSRLTAGAARRFLAEVCQHWARHGFGYWTVTCRGTGRLVGMAGVRVVDTEVLTLCYRVDSSVHGHGFGREAARAAVAYAAEWVPGRRVRAVIRPDYASSIRITEAAGLVDIGTLRHPDDPDDGPPSRLFEAPRLVRRTRFADGERAQVLDLWCRVNDAGGSVGFLPGAPREVVDRALAVHERQMADGDAVAGLLIAPRGALVGCAWWARGSNPLLHHGRWLSRVMTDPDCRRSHRGTLLMAGMHRLAREDGVELLQLGYRSGSGVSAFYGSLGYHEVGRVPGAIRVGPGDDRDDVTMARRVDGGPFVTDGRG